MAGLYRLAAGWLFLSDGRKYYTAIVQNIHYSAPAGYEVKEVSALLDAHPYCCPSSSGFGTGWRITISVPGAMSIKRRFLQA